MCAADGSVERERAELSADVVVEGHAASPLAIAAAIRDLKVDVLVDMCGHAGSSDVAQVLAIGRRGSRSRALGTPAPMGGAGIFDWCLCDGVVAPEHLKTAAGWGAGDHGALRLPRTYFVGDAEAYKRHELDGVRTARSDHGLRDGAVVLACMNRPHKVDRDGFDGWVGVVRDPRTRRTAPSPTTLRRGARCRRAVDDVVRGEPFDVCYLYVYPDHWPSPPRVADDPNRFRVSTTPGFRTWCLLAYVVSKRGAEKLRRLIETEEVYAPIDCMVADWGSRGLLDVRCVDAKGFVDNAGQLDMRVPDDADALPSNIWGTADFGASPPVHSRHAARAQGRAARRDPQRPMQLYCY
ncbi:phosphatase [Aureococcus anophagefferens]|nr:phosphatase [Aureococcus anophagefferens]